MSIVKTEIILVNKGDATNVKRGLIKEDEIRQMTVQATVDTGAWTLVINEEIRQKLGLRYRGYGEANRVNFVDDADGKKEVHQMAGPVEINQPRRKRTGYGCFGKVFVSGYIPFLRPKGRGMYPSHTIKWKNRSTTCRALVLPDATEVLLGAIPLEDMDLTVNPLRELVGVHGDIVSHRV